MTTLEKELLAALKNIAELRKTWMCMVVEHPIKPPSDLAWSGFKNALRIADQAIAKAEAQEAGDE